MGSHIKKETKSEPAFAAEDDIYIFARKALAEFKVRCNYAITDGLFRVDVMCGNDGKMRVNEFEGFEAVHHVADNKNKNGELDRKMYEYWLQKLHELL
jgi:hypothetical protein